MRKYLAFYAIIFSVFLFCNSFISQIFAMEQNFQAQEAFVIEFKSACVENNVEKLAVLLQQDENNFLALKNSIETVYGFYTAIKNDFFNVVYGILENKAAFEQLKKGVALYSEAFVHFLATACEKGNVKVIAELLKKPTILDSLTTCELIKIFNIALSTKQVAIAKLLAQSLYVTARLWPNLSGA